MPAPKDPIRRLEFIRKQSEAHIGKLSGDKNPNYKPRVEIVCPICGKIFSEKPSHADERVCCSRVCQGIRQKQTLIGSNNPFYGKSHTIDTKQIVSRKNTGLKRTLATRRKQSEIKKGVPHSKEHSQNIGKSLMGREIVWKDKISATHQGVSIDEWGGFVTPLHSSIRGNEKYFQWRDAVFKRDNYCDGFTGVKGSGNLHAHHIVSFSSLMQHHNIQSLDDALACDALWDVANGITMIDSNHMTYHSLNKKEEMILI